MELFIKGVWDSNEKFVLSFFIQDIGGGVDVDSLVLSALLGHPDEAIFSHVNSKSRSLSLITTDSIEVGAFFFLIYLKVLNTYANVVLTIIFFNYSPYFNLFVTLKLIYRLTKLWCCPHWKLNRLNYSYFWDTNLIELCLNIY